MISTGKCPKCSEKISHVDIEGIDVHQNLRKAYEGVVFLCPKCKTIISASLDPLRLCVDTANAVVKKLKQ